MIEINDKLLEYADKYEKAFGYSLPLRMLPQTLTNEELYVVIDECIDKDIDDIETRYISDVDDTVLL